MRTDSKVTRRSKKHKIIAAAMVLILAVSGVIAVSGHGSTDSEAAISIEKANAETGDVANTVSATGSLAEDLAISVKVPSGVKINDIMVSEGDKVKKGDILAKVDRASVAETLLTLKETEEDIEEELSALGDTSDTTSTNYLKKIVYESEIEEIEEAETKLNKMLMSGAIKAGKSGTITSIGIEEGETVGGSSGASSGAGNETASYSSPDSSLTTSGTTASVTKNDANISTAATCCTTSTTTQDANLYETVSCSTISDNGENRITIADDAAGTTIASTASLNVASTGMASEIRPYDESTKEDNYITNDDLKNITIVRPVTGNTPQERIASSSKFDATIKWDVIGKFQGGKVYTAAIELASKNGYAFDSGSSYMININGATLVSGTPKVTGGTNTGNKLVIKAKFVRTEEESKSDRSGAKKSTKGSANVKESSSGKASSNKNVNGQGSSGSSGSISTGIIGSSGSVSTGSAESGSTDSEDSTNDDSISNKSSTSDVVEEVSIISISSNKMMSVSVSIDEADINSVKAGQSASVSLDAVDGKTFEGEITKVSASSSSGNSGNAESGSSAGNVKYEATIELDKTSKMKAGMTASVTINVEEANNVITIPSSAVNEEDGKTYVYTKRSDDSLTGEKEITTGLSNGNICEVTSGLSEGDTIYYEIRTNDDSDSRNDQKGQNEMESFGGEQGGSAGGPPSDGGMPGAPGGGNSNG